MSKSVIFLVFGACVCTAAGGTLKAAAAEAISVPIQDSQFEARGGWGGGGGVHNSPLHGLESWQGPPVIALALPIALILVVALWVAAYNTLRSPPPNIGYNAGIVESAGWGGQQASSYISGGWGYDPAASEQQAGVASNVVAQTVAAQAAPGGVANPAGVAAAARAFDELTHRVTRSIERQEKADN